MDENVSGHRLDRLFRPRSIALIGASDRNFYSGLAHNNLESLGFAGPRYQVNRSGGIAHGRPSVTSCAKIGEEVDAAILLVPLSGLMESVTDAVEAGIKNLVIITSGFAETGVKGQEIQAELARFCAAHDVRVIGPNALGYRNNLDHVALGCIPYVVQHMPPSIAAISASGSVSFHLATYAVQQGIGLTHALAFGNEMNISSADLIDYFVEDPRVKGIAMFLETIKNPQAFARAAERARAAGKPIVVLKAGAAEATAAVAAAHTGALVGDDKVFNAACERLAIVRVSTIEELIVTAAALAAVGPINPPGVSITSISGGSSEIMSDLGKQYGLPIPQFAPETVTELQRVISDFGQTYNPIDLTGAAVRDTGLWESVPRITSNDPGIGLAIINYDIPESANSTYQETLDRIGDGLNACCTPTLLLGTLTLPINEHGRAYMAKHNVKFAIAGLGMGIFALGKAVQWSQRLAQSRSAAPLLADDAGKIQLAAARPTTEREALEHLANHGVAVIPAKVAHGANDAVNAAKLARAPVALKILSPDIAHKSDAGGVKLNLSGDEAVSTAYEAIIKSVKAAHPDARIEGVLVSPMRTGGLELFVGIARDPDWGLVMALSLGGIWVEALDDTALCLLPVSPAEVVAAFKGLRAAKLLEGYRGGPAVDMDLLAETVVKIGDAAMALGPDLAAFEINPLYANGSHIEALDALAVWESMGEAAA